MINQFLLICSTIVIYEFVKYIKLIDIVSSNLKIYKKILKLFKFKNVSDFRKEKLIFGYSKLLFILSIKIFIIIISMVFFIVILNFLSNSFLNLIISFLGFLEISIVFFVYHQFRKKSNAKL